MSNINQYKHISAHTNCEVRKNISNNQNGLFSTSSFLKEDIIIDFGASEIVDSPNYLTVQVAERKHIHLTPDYLQYINHSCEPNVLFNTSTMQLECLTDIVTGDELTFFYPATEWKMSQTFNCHCGKSVCIGLVMGAADMPSEVLKKYKLTGFIQSMLLKHNAL